MKMKLWFQHTISTNLATRLMTKLEVEFGLCKTDLVEADPTLQLDLS